MFNDLQLKSNRNLYGACQESHGDKDVNQEGHLHTASGSVTLTMNFESSVWIKIIYPLPLQNLRETVAIYAKWHHQE